MRQIPKSEILWKTENAPGGTFYITSDKLRAKYTLWKKGESGVVKIKSAVTPEKFNATLDSYWNPTSDEKPKRKRSG